MTLGSGVTSVTPAATDMDNGFVCDGKTYYREGATLTLTGVAPTGYLPVFSANGTVFSGITYTVNSTDGDVTLDATGDLEPITYTQYTRIIETIIRSPILSRLAMPIIFIAVVLVIVGIDLLISWNDFSGFFKILGVELLAAVIVWILKMVFSKSKTSDDSDGRNVSEV